MMPLAGKRAAVTGAGSHGIGRAITLALGEAGCDVAVQHHDQAAAAEELAATIAGAGRSTCALAADLSDPAAGPWMCHRHLRLGYDPEDVITMVRRLFADRVVFHQGEGLVLPGVTVHHMGGHTSGLQAVRVHTERGQVVLASDAAVFYEGLETGRPFPAALHVGQELEGYATLRRLASSPGHIIPGHDIGVMERYPLALENVAWRVDLPPRA